MKHFIAAILAAQLICGLPDIGGAADQGGVRKGTARLEQENARQAVRITQLEKELAAARNPCPRCAGAGLAAINPRDMESSGFIRRSVTKFKEFRRWLFALIRKIDLYLRAWSDQVPFLKRLRGAYFDSREKGVSYFDVIAAAQKSINPTKKEYQSVNDLAQDYNKNMNANLPNYDSILPAVSRDRKRNGQDTVKFADQQNYIEKELMNKEAPAGAQQNRW